MDRSLSIEQILPKTIAQVVQWIALQLRTVVSPKLNHSADTSHRVASRHLHCVTFYTRHLEVTQQALSDKTPARCKRESAIDERSRAFNSTFCTGFGIFSKPIRFEFMLFFLVSSKVFSPLQAKFLFQDFMAVKRATAVFRNPAPASSCTKLPRIGKLVTSLT